MAHKKYIVKQGDCISSIAYRQGLFPDTVWNDSKNSKLKQDRKDPNVLCPGDVVYVRDKEEKKESFASEQRHRFRRKGVPEKLVVQFTIYDEPRSNEAYTLEINGMLNDGTTDEDGKIDIFIPPDANTCMISFTETGEEYEMKLGHLDPITEIEGLQGRLINLGFYTGAIDGSLNKETVRALINFQNESNLNPTGKPDEPTLKALSRNYGHQGSDAGPT